MQTILGAGGAIGVPLAKALTHYTDRIRLVSRNPQRVNPQDELHPADLTDAESVERAVEGSDIVYLVVGLPYDIEVWRTAWPRLMENVIAACQKHGAKLVFFDNIYMYDPDYLAQMTENTPFRPISKKGVVRERVARMVLEGINKGELTALIARAPDFLDGESSVLYQMATKNLQAGKTANWQCALDKAHTFIYTKDAARATARLGNTPDAFNQTWHLPTDRTPRTGREWVELLAEHLQAKPRVRVLPNWLMTVMGWFVPIMRELREMSYQYDRDYIFDSTKYEQRFGEKATPVERALTPGEAVS